MPLLPWFAVVLLASASRAWAQPPEEPQVREESPLRVRGAVGGALLVSKDQTGVLGFSGSGLELEAQVGRMVRPWFEPHLGVLGGVFPAQEGGPGGLLAPLAGVRVGTSGLARQVYVSLDAGPGFTGPRVRPYVRAAVGADIRVSRSLTLGPRLGYFRLFRPRAPNTSTDASGIDLMVCLGFRPRMAPPPEDPPSPAPEIVERVRWVEQKRPPQEPLPPAEPPEELLILLEKAVPASRMELLAPVLFRFDSDQLEPIGVAMLHEVARVLAERSDIQLLEIQGYADARGDSEYNRALSLRRAEQVRQWLITHGVEAQRLSVAAHGASAPVEPGSAERDHQQNRRVVFRVLRMESP